MLAVDISESMLAVAAELAREAGLRNVDTLVGDGSALQLPGQSFDAAICRFGLMFMPDLAAALRGVRLALKPGSRFAALVWSAQAKNPSMAIPIEVVSEQRGLPSPPPLIVQAFSLSAPGVLEQALGGAGFQDVAVEAVSVPRHSASLDEAMAALTALGEMLGQISESEKTPLEAEVRRRFQAFTQPDGSVLLPGEAHLASATAP